MTYVFGLCRRIDDDGMHSNTTDNMCLYATEFGALDDVIIRSKSVNLLLEIT